LEAESARLEAQAAAALAKAQALCEAGEAALSKARKLEQETADKFTQLKKEMLAEKEALQKEAAEARRKSRRGPAELPRRIKGRPRKPRPRWILSAGSLKTSCVWRRRGSARGRPRRP